MPYINFFFFHKCVGLYFFLIKRIISIIHSSLCTAISFLMSVSCWYNAFVKKSNKLNFFNYCFFTFSFFFFKLENCS